jgi:microcin C transport system substrate-binding protein
MMNPKNLTSLFRVDLSRFSRPEVLDERTIRITAKQPHWNNFWSLASLTAFPKHVWKDVDFNKQNLEFPVVSGPYRIEEVKMNRSVRFERRSDWWGRARQYNIGKYNFDHLIFVAMEDRIKVLEAFKKGDLDNYAVYTASMWAEQTKFPQVQKNWVVRQEIFNDEPKSFQGFVLNMRRPIFADLKTRQALTFLLNRQLMNEKLMFNQYFLLNSYFPDLYPNYENPAIPITKYDPEKARALLGEAGWQVGPDGILVRDGKKFSLTILNFDPSLSRHLNIYVQDMKAVGIDAKIEMLSMASFGKRADNHDYDMFWMRFGAARLEDPEAIWSSKTADDIATQNFPAVKDPEIDRLIEQQKTEMDASKRKDILRKIDARLMEIVPYVLLWESPCTKLLWWNKFGTPKFVISKFSDNSGEFDAPVYWWFDPAKAKALEEAMKTNTALPPQPAEVHFAE